MEINMIENIQFYGMDNRKDLYEIVNFEISKYARATCCLVDNSYIEAYDNFNYKINCRSTGYCSDVRFHDQKRLAECSAFAIAPDIILTAGHCITEEKISRFSILYEFNLPEKVEESDSIVKSDNVYKIIKLLERGKLSNGLDYAILNIDRPVSDDRILKIRRTGKISDNSKLYVAGYPDGLPLKISNDGNIRKNDNDIIFITDLDTFQGNSGSPVFNEITHVVEGILTKGDTDFFYDDKNRCQRLFKCSEKECSGETVVRITELLPYIQKYLNN
jgi:V8-like Glu-specific endopeptidase